MKTETCLREGLSFGGVSPYAPGAIHRAKCPDGKERNATVTNFADTYWTVPARINCKGKTVSGFLHFVTRFDLEQMPVELHFVPGGKNADLLPRWENQGPIWNGKGEAK